MITRTFWLFAALSALIATTGIYAGGMVYAFSNGDSPAEKLILSSIVFCAWSICMAMLGHLFSDAWDGFVQERQRWQHQRQINAYKLDADVYEIAERREKR